MDASDIGQLREVDAGELQRVVGGDLFMDIAKSVVVDTIIKGLGEQGFVAQAVKAVQK